MDGVLIQKLLLFMKNDPTCQLLMPAEKGSFGVIFCWWEWQGGGWGALGACANWQRSAAADVAEIPLIRHWHTYSCPDQHHHTHNLWHQLYQPLNKYFSVCIKDFSFYVDPDVDFGDGSPADSNLRGKQTNGAGVGSGGSSVWPPTDDRKTIKIEKIVWN